MDRRQQLTTTRILWGALSFGPLAFALVAHFVVVRSMPPPSDPTLPRILPIIAAGLGLVMLAVSRFLPPRAVPAKSGQPPELVHRTRIILASALCEGASLFAVVAYIIAHDTKLLAIGLIPYLGLLTLFPNEEQLDAVEREQQREPQG